jgi:hypothetical protein
MSRTIDYLTPGGAETKTTTFPAPGRTSDASGARPYLAFDAATDEAAYWTMRTPQGFTGTMTLVGDYIMASATSGVVRWGGSIEAITDGDSTDLDAGESLDTENVVDVTVPATAGFIDQFSITLTTQDSAAVGDYMRVRIRRVGSNAADTATGDALFLGAELMDAA